MPVDTILTVKAIAARDNLTAAAVSKFIRDHAGIPVERDARGRVSGVDVAAWDRARSAWRDSAKVRHKPQDAPRSLAAPESGLDAARLEDLQARTRLNRMRGDEQAGNLIRRDLIEQAIARIGAEIGREIELQRYADRLARVLGVDEIKPLRGELKAISHEIATRVADLCARLAIDAPAHDPALHEETDLI